MPRSLVSKNDLDLPLARTLERRRASRQGSEGIARVFCGVFSDDRELWLLHAFRKQTQRAPPDDLAPAKRRLKALREEKKTKRKR